MNERIPLIKEINNYYNENNSKKNFYQAIKKWFVLEKMIKDKKTKKMKKDYKMPLIYYFSDNSNKEILLQIFNQDVIDCFLYKKIMLEEYQIQLKEN